jgi:hypothetical protein
MAIKGTRNPTLRDLYNGLKEDGSFDRDIVELVLEANSELLADAVVKEANGRENDRTTIRTGLPDATWTAYYEGVQPSKGSKKQVSNAIGTLKSLIQVDKELIDDRPTAPRRCWTRRSATPRRWATRSPTRSSTATSRSTPRSSTAWSRSTTPTAGWIPRRAPTYCIQSSARSTSASNTALRSIWLIGWGRRGAYLHFPRGSKGGLERGPVKENTITVTGDGARLEVKEQFFKWRVGLTVKDFRACGRICNIESNNLSTLDKDIGEDMLRLKTRVKTGGLKPVFYMPESVYEWLAVKTRRQVLVTSFTFKDPRRPGGHALRRRADPQAGVPRSQRDGRPGRDVSHTLPSPLPAPAFARRAGVRGGINSKKTTRNHRMNLDKNLMFSEAQDLASAASTNILDLKDCGDDLSRRLNVFAKIDGGAVAGGTSMAAKLETGDDGENFADLVTYPTRAIADINADGWIVKPQPLPSGVKRYLRLTYTAVGSFTGAGKILAGLTASLDTAL